MSTTVNRERFVTGMTGVYFVAAELSAKGYVVTTTARNAPGIDIMASTPDLKRTFNIQVKANKVGGTQAYWLLDKNANRTESANLLYVFVNLKENAKPDFYIVPSHVVAKNVEHSRAKNSEWWSFHRDNKYKDRWDLFS